MTYLLSRFFLQLDTYFHTFSNFCVEKYMIYIASHVLYSFIRLNIHLQSEWYTIWMTNLILQFICTGFGSLVYCLLIYPITFSRKFWLFPIFIYALKVLHWWMKIKIYRLWFSVLVVITNPTSLVKIAGPQTVHSNFTDEVSMFVVYWKTMHNLEFFYKFHIDQWSGSFYIYFKDLLKCPLRNEREEESCEKVGLEVNHECLNDFLKSCETVL